MKAAREEVGARNNHELVARAIAEGHLDGLDLDPDEKAETSD